MPEYNQAFEAALSARKFDLLAGRTPDLVSRMKDALRAFYDAVIRPLLEAFEFANIDGPQAAISAGFLQNLFMIIAIILAVCAAVYAAFRVRIRRRRAASIREIFGDLHSGAYTFDELVADADRAAAAHQYREAVRLLYIALLWTLNTQNIIYYTDYKSNSRIKRELSQNAAHLCERFARVLEVYNRGWFGHKKLTTQEYETNSQVIFELINDAKTTAGAV